MLLVAPVLEKHRVPLTEALREQMLHDPDLRHRVNIRRSTLPAITHVDAEVSLVGDEENARALVHVAVVMDIDQEVARQALLLDPLMKDRDEVFQPDGCGIVRVELDSEAMAFHYRFLLPAAPRSVSESWQAYVASMKSCASSTMR